MRVTVNRLRDCFQSRNGPIRCLNSTLRFTSYLKEGCNNLNFGASPPESPPPFSLHLQSVAQRITLHKS